MRLIEVAQKMEELGFLFSMMKKAMRRGLYAPNKWGDVGRVSEIIPVAWHGELILRLKLDVDPEMHEDEVVNTCFVNRHNVNQTTLKKQDDGSYLVATKDEVSEAVDEPLVLSMLNRLLAKGETVQYGTWMRDSYNTFTFRVMPHNFVKKAFIQKSNGALVINHTTEYSQSVHSQIDVKHIPNVQLKKIDGVWTLSTNSWATDPDWKKQHEAK